MPAEAARIVDLYRRHAAAFIAQRSRRMSERGWLDRFRALLPPDGRVLDLGCGFGEPIARTLVAQGHGVTGLDTAPALLAEARRAMPAQEWLLGDMREVSLGRRFAGILAWDSFFHLDHDDQRRMFPRFAAHAAPGAALMFTSGPARGEAIGQWQGEALYHASLDAADYAALLAAHGFVLRAHVVEDPGAEGRTVWLAQRAATGATGPQSG